MKALYTNSLYVCNILMLLYKQLVKLVKLVKSSIRLLELVSYLEPSLYFYITNKYSTLYGSSFYI